MILAILATVTVLSIVMGALMVIAFSPDDPSDTYLAALATLCVTAVVSGTATIIAAIWKFLV